MTKKNLVTTTYYLLKMTKRLVSAYFAVWPRNTSSYTKQKSVLSQMGLLYRFVRQSLFHINTFDLQRIICWMQVKFCAFKKEGWDTTVHAACPTVQDVLTPFSLNRDENALRNLSFNLAFNLITLLPPSLCWILSGITPSLTSTGKSSIIEYEPVLI